MSNNSSELSLHYKHTIWNPAKGQGICFVLMAACYVLLDFHDNKTFLMASIARLEEVSILKA